MGMPVKLSDELVQAARTEAHAANRSLTAQIEHWAKLGQAVEALLKHPEMLALKHSGGDPARLGDALQAGQDAIHQALSTLAASQDRAPVRARLQASRGPLYEACPGRPDLIVRVEADGTRTPGRLENRRFIAVDEIPAPPEA